MPSPLPGRTLWARRLAAPLLVPLVLVVAVSTACRPTAEPSAAPERTGRGEAQASLASRPAPTRTTIHRVFGRLPDARRKTVRQQVGAVVDRWWEAAYLGGPYPRGTFPSAFPGFTDAAEGRARADKVLLTNRTLGPRIDSVTARRRSVVLDILAAGGQARTVTAHVLLRFDTTGRRAGTTTVRGRLFLTRKRGAWRIFGYDIAKGAR
jgi:hypothetical protein